jgi:hypothetical protein
LGVLALPVKIAEAPAAPTSHPGPGNGGAAPDPEPAVATYTLFSARVFEGPAVREVEDSTRGVRVLDVPGEFLDDCLKAKSPLVDLFSPPQDPADLDPDVSRQVRECLGARKRVTAYGTLRKKRHAETVSVNSKEREVDCATENEEKSATPDPAEGGPSRIDADNQACDAPKPTVIEPLRRATLRRRSETPTSPPSRRPPPMRPLSALKATLLEHGGSPF